MGEIWGDLEIYGEIAHLEEEQADRRAVVPVACSQCNTPRDECTSAVGGRRGVTRAQAQWRQWRSKCGMCVCVCEHSGHGSSEWYPSRTRRQCQQS